MAKNNNRNELDNISKKSSVLVYGTSDTLQQEDKELQNVIQQTVIETKNKYGTRTNDKPINYFNQLNISDVYSEFFDNNKKDKSGETSTKISGNKLNDLMTQTGMMDATSALLSDSERLMQINNYRIIYNNIPECSAALDTYKDNIMSPDDFTKMIFNIKYNNTSNEKIKDMVESNLEDITKKYELEKKADKIISDTLMTGETFVAVLSLEDELNDMLSDGVFQQDGQTLNEEAIRFSDKDYVDSKILSEQIQLNSKEVDAFSEVFKTLGSSVPTQDYNKVIAEMVNNCLQVGSKKELLIERFEGDISFKDKSFTLADIPGATKRNSKKTSQKVDAKALGVNGSSIRILEPEKVIELRVDNVCYGYYYAEESGNSIGEINYMGPKSGREVEQGVNIAANNTIAGTPNSVSYQPTTSASLLGVSDAKLKVISNVFIDAFAKKVNKDFIRKNKKFKDFIYSLVKQEYIIKKGVRLIYFKPEDVIKFEAPAVFRKIVFFAKLYLSVLSNDILIKLGRAHDKRVFYVNVGVDANYEQAVQTVVRDIKTKEYKMDNLNDFNTILNLNPGRFDDYVIPTINGDRPIDIDTLAGMDTEMNNEFMEYLKNSMVTGMGVPRNLLDATSEMDFARSLSAQNANFVRSVIRYQSDFTDPFTVLYQHLYKNEYRFIGDKENTDQNIDIEDIKVSFNSPASLNMSNISDQIQAVDGNADFIASQIVVPAPDGSNEVERVRLKSEIVKDLMPGIDWDKYKTIYEDLKIKMKKEEISAPQQSDDNFQNPYGNEY